MTPGTGRHNGQGQERRSVAEERERVGQSAAGEMASRAVVF